jgi:AcrR family transcriptional regulator
MGRRAELVDETRQRITEAAVHLHTTVGPTQTSIASVAAEAGVTRLTVYRHFADLDTLFLACRAHWLAQDPPPDASAWPAIADLDERVRHALTELYEWYRRRGEELYPIYRDGTTLPLATQAARREENRAQGDALVAGFVQSGERGRRLQAVARHLCDFGTWRSLAVQQGLDDREVVDVGARLISAVLAPAADPATARPTLPDDGDPTPSAG